MHQSENTKIKLITIINKVRFDTSPEIHVYRNGISDTTKYSHATSRPSRFFLKLSFGTNFPFSFGQTQSSSRLCSPRQTSLTTSANVSIICLETSHSSSQSSGSDQQYDSIPFEMVDGHQLLHSGNAHSSSRSQCIPFYGCLSLWLGSSSRADETILSWSLVRRPIPAPYQYAGNNGHSFRTEESHKLYQQTRRNTFSQLMCRGMGDPPLVSGT